MPEQDSEENAVETSDQTRRERDCADMRSKNSLFNLMGKTHTMEIAREFALESDPWRFNELKEQLELSPNTLSKRLSEFVEAGLITRHSYDEIPPRVEYEATAKARELEPIFEDLHDWIERHEH